MTRLLEMAAATTMVGLLVGIGASPAAAQSHSIENLQSSVDLWASEIGAPGMSAQIVDTDSVLAKASTGVDGNDKPVDASTPFVWGSVSKQFTAAVVFGLENEGVIEGTESVLDVVPGARRMLPDPSVTVDDLLHHTSGLPHDITVTDDWSRRESATAAVESISAPDGIEPPGTFRYSSLNYMLLQAVVETATGNSFAEVLHREVLDPAHASGIITDPAVYAREIPPGHVPFFGSPKPLAVGVDSAGLGYGYLAGSTDELGKYASWRLGRLQGAEEAAAEVDTGQGTEYGDGLFREKIGGQDVWWHSGAIPGYYTYVAMIPGQDRAVVLATNRYGEIEAERIAAVGRNLTTLVIDGTTSDLPRSLASTVLPLILGIVAALVGVIAWVTSRLFTGGSKRRSALGTAVRILITAALGGAIVLGGIVVLPSIVGASLSVMWLWAPDVTLAFWTLLGTAVLASALVVAREVVDYIRSREGDASGTGGSPRNSWPER